MRQIAPEQDRESIRLGLWLTVLQLAVYFVFILMSCFYAKSLAAVVPGSDIPWSFVAGLGVIACGTILTVFYVVRINRLDDAQTSAGNGRQ